LIELTYDLLAIRITAFGVAVGYYLKFIASGRNINAVDVEGDYEFFREV